MSIGGIGNAYGAYQMYRTRPMNYVVQNQSDVSDAYKESIGLSKARSMDPTPPVLYPNAQKVPAGAVKAPQADEETVNRQFNSIAARYSGVNTGYERNGQGQGYEMTGSLFDARV